MYAFIVTGPPPCCKHDFIDLILSSPILNVLVFHSLVKLFYLRKWRIDLFVSNTHHFLVSHSVSSSLPRKTFLLIVVSNIQLFYLSSSLRKLSYANVKESYFRRTTTVIAMFLTKVLNFSYETATAITLSNSKNSNNNSIKQVL